MDYLWDFVSTAKSLLFLKMESLSSKLDTLEALSYETLISLPQICFFPVDAVSLLVSIACFCVLNALLSSSSLNTFSLSCLISFLKVYFYSYYFLLGLSISPIVTLNILLAWLIFLSIKELKSSFLLLYLFSCNMGFLIDFVKSASVLAS